MAAPSVRTVGTVASSEIRRARRERRKARKEREEWASLHPWRRRLSTAWLAFMLAGLTWGQFQESVLPPRPVHQVTELNSDNLFRKHFDPRDFAPVVGALPAVRSVGTVVSGIGTVSPGLPAGTTTNDICIIASETSAETVSWSGGNQTWKIVPGLPEDATGTRITLFWTRITSASPTMPTSNDPADHILARAISFSGCATTGVPFDALLTNLESTSDTTMSILGNSTQVADCLIVLAASVNLPDANGTANFSGHTNADLANLTERVDNTTNAGNGGGLGMWTGEKATAGTYGPTTVTLATAASKAMVSLALRPATAATTDIRCHRLLDGGSTASATSYTTGTAYEKTNGRPVILNLMTRLAGGSIAPTTVTVSSGETATLLFSSPFGTDSSFHIYGFIATSSGTFTVTFDWAGITQAENLWGFYEIENAETADGITGIFVNGSIQNMYGSLTNGNTREICAMSVSDPDNATLIFAFAGGNSRDFTALHGETIIQQATPGAGSTSTFMEGFKLGSNPVTGVTWSGTAVSNGIAYAEVRAAGSAQPKISQRVLTSASNDGNGPYTSASVDPTDNTGLLLVFASSRNGLGANGGIPNLTGTLTSSLPSGWTQVADVQFNTTGTPRMRVTVWQAQSGTGSGTVIFTAPDANNYISGSWAIIEHPGVDATDFVAQIKTARADASTNPSITFDNAFGHADNGTLGIFTFSNDTVVGESTGEGSGFRRIVKTAATAPDCLLAVEFRNGNDSTVDYTASSADWAGVIIELKAETVATVERAAGIDAAGSVATTATFLSVFERSDAVGATGTISAAGVQVGDPWKVADLQAVAFNADRIDLTWTAVAESGIAFYLIERNGSVIDTTTETSFSDTGLDPDTEYTYRVRAVQEG